MALPLHILTDEALALEPAERLQLATELMDSVEDPERGDWSGLWTTEVRRRSAAADAREAQGQPRGADWDEVRERLLLDLARR